MMGEKGMPLSELEILEDFLEGTGYELTDEEGETGDEPAGYHFQKQSSHGEMIHVRITIIDG